MHPKQYIYHCRIKNDDTSSLQVFFGFVKTSETKQKVKYNNKFCLKKYMYFKLFFFYRKLVTLIENRIQLVPYVQDLVAIQQKYKALLDYESVLFCKDSVRLRLDSSWQ